MEIGKNGQPVLKQDLKDILDEYFQEKVQVLVSVVTKPLQDKIQELEKAIAQLSQSHNGPTTNYFQNINPKTLVIYGLSEDVNESPAALYKKVVDLGKEMGFNNFDFHDAKRIGIPVTGKTRVVRLQLLQTGDKWSIFAAKRQLWAGEDGKPDHTRKYANICINEDLSKEERKINGVLRGKLRNLQLMDEELMGMVRRGVLTIKKADTVIHKYKWTPEDFPELK